MELLTATRAEAEQRRVAAGLERRGVAEGDRVVVVARSSTALLTVVMGALRRGVIPVVLTPALTPTELAPLVRDADATLVLDDDGVAELAGVEGDPETDLMPFPAGRPMHYTSGTTGRPKGVWSGVLDEVSAAALVAEEQELWGLDEGDRHLVCSPLHHSAPIRFAAGTLLAGGDVVVLGRFTVDGVAEAIRRWSPTTSFMVPTHLQRLLVAPPPFVLFRLVAHAGAPCPQKLKLAALERFPTGSLWEFYGSTEVQFTACSPHEWTANPGRSAGRDPAAG